MFIVKKQSDLKKKKRKEIKKETTKRKESNEIEYKNLNKTKN